MRKLLIITVLAIMLAGAKGSLYAQISFNANDFSITNLSTDLNSENPVILVSIYCKQSSARTLPYPTLSAVTDKNGDTIATAYTQFFGHSGQDTVTYTLQLRKNTTPTFEDCKFRFSGPFDGNKEGLNCILIYDPSKLAIKPEITILNCSDIKITDILVYHPNGVLPELYISICFNSPDNKMLLSPFIQSVKTLSGKLVGEGFVDNIEFYCHRGQDTLVYRSFLNINKIPDLTKCEFYFVCPGNENGKDAICKLRYTGVVKRKK